MVTTHLYDLRSRRETVGLRCHRQLVEKFFRLLPILFLLTPNFLTPSLAQTPCGWQDGEMLTYSQSDWGDASSAAGILLGQNFDANYPADFVVGTPNSIRLTDAAALYTYLPAVGVANILTSSVQNPVTTSAAELGGEVAGLKLNIDFSDANQITGIVPLGDLVIYNFSQLPQLNGQTVRQFLATASSVLGGTTGLSISPTQAAAFARFINGAFLTGTPSQFAQDHLKRVWQQGEMITYNQIAWGTPGSAAGTILSNDFAPLYFSSGGVLEVGIPGSGYSIRLSSGPVVLSYLPASGTANPLTGDVVDPTATAAGILGGEVVALKLNIDFNDGGYLQGTSNILFGDLVLYGLTDFPSLNGLTVRQVLALAETVLGGGSSTLTPAEVVSMTQKISLAFANGTPSQFAQEHLKKGWSNGDMLNYNQTTWGANLSDAGDLLVNNFPNLYGSDLTIGDGYTVSFTSAASIFSFLPAAGLPAPLTSTFVDPFTTPAGELAGQVLALTLNVDFSDSNLVNAITPLGDLIMYNMTFAPQLNGQTVRQFLATANYELGGGSGAPLTAGLASAIGGLLNNAFANGTPSQFAQDHLALPCGSVSTNHCPTAAAISKSTGVGTSIKFPLQGTDADGDALTYTISQNPGHGTATIIGPDSVSYTPAAAYSGSDQFKYKASDGTCDAEATVDITIVVCPVLQGFWKNNPNAWPASATPMLLGTVSYTKSQLITILKTPIGTGMKADASLILADQLIGAKVSIANGSPVPQAVLDSIASADARIGGSLVPMNVRPNTPLGKRMTPLATFLEGYGNGALTAGCGLNKLLADDISVLIPTAYVLEQNYPNPFNPETRINYGLPEAAHVRLVAYDILGREVTTLVDEIQTAGYKSVRFDASHLASGVYFCRLSAGSFTQLRKMVLLR